MNDHETLENMMKEIQQVVTHHAGAKNACPGESDNKKQ